MTRKDRLLLFGMALVFLTLNTVLLVANERGWDCDRLNEVIATGNERGDVLYNFIMKASETREAQAVEATDDGNATEARINSEAATYYRQQAARLNTVDLLDCGRG